MFLIYAGSSVSVFPLPDKYLEVQDKKIAITVDWIAHKAVHTIEYSVLGVIGVNVFRKLHFTKNHAFIWTWILGILFAISDEMHQMTVPYRSGKILDIAIDGVSLTYTLVLLKLNDLFKNVNY
jgi:VanZ family protein